MKKCNDCSSCNCKTPSVLQLADLIAETYPDLKAFLIDGHDDAIVGIAIDRDDLANGGFRIVYDQDKIIEKTMGDGMDYDEAAEFCQYNIFSAHLGVGSPVYRYDAPEYE